MARNRIQSGLSCGVIVVAAEKGSGSMHTVRFARSQGRPVAVVTATSDGVRLPDGSSLLLSEGATALSTLGDLQAWLNVILPHPHRAQADQAEHLVVEPGVTGR